MRPRGVLNNCKTHHLRSTVGTSSGTAAAPKARVQRNRKWGGMEEGMRKGHGIRVLRDKGCERVQKDEKRRVCLDTQDGQQGLWPELAPKYSPYGRGKGGVGVQRRDRE